MKPSQVQSNEYAPYYANFISNLSDEYTLIEELEIALHRFIKFVQNLPMDKFDYRYAEGKWTIKDIIQHVIDCERAFSYRALRIARNDKTELPEAQWFTSPYDGKLKKSVGKQNSDYQVRYFNSNTQPLYVILSPDGNPLDTRSYDPDVPGFVRFLDGAKMAIKK